jgi:hypothetical protein
MHDLESVHDARAGKPRNVLFRGADAAAHEF